MSNKVLDFEDKKTELTIKKVKKDMIKNEGVESYFRLKGIEGALNKLNEIKNTEK